jgi:hypothetical protein
MQTQGYHIRLAAASALSVILLSLLPLPSSSAAQSGGGYDVVWSTIASASGTASGGTYQLGGTVGQSSTGILSGEGYTLNGGFWSGIDAPHHVYLPIVLR